MENQKEGEYVIYCGKCGKSYDLKEDGHRCPNCGTIPFVD